MDRQAALSEFFEHFGLAYSALDVDRVAATFVMPFTTNVQGDITHWPEFEPLRHTTAVLFDWYYQQGFRSAHYRVVEQVMVGRDHATVELCWHVARADRHYWVHHTGYQLRWVNEEWKICGIMQITEPEQTHLVGTDKEIWTPLALAEAALAHAIQRPGSPLTID
jgi:hypothetical protein